MVHIHIFLFNLQIIKKKLNTILVYFLSDEERNWASDKSYSLSKALQLFPQLIESNQWISEKEYTYKIWNSTEPLNQTSDIKGK